MEQTVATPPEASPPDDLAAAVLDALAEPALLVTMRGAIVRANPAAAGILGVAASELRERALTSFLIGDDEPALSRLLELCARSKSPLPGAIRLRRQASDASPGATGAPTRHRITGALVRPASRGSPALILLRIRVEEGASSRFTLLNHQIDDMTRELRRRRAAEQALREANAELAEQRRIAERARSEAETANRAKSDFLAVMSHELRTPLNAIGGYVDLLDLGVYGQLTDQQRQSLDRVQRAQRRLLVLINEVLTFARLEVGRVEYTITEFPVAGLLRELEPIVAPQIQAKELSFSCRVRHEDALARADRERVEQIVINLLSNAIKFTPSGGRITLEEASDDRIVRIRVRDTGIGIPDDKIERIFDPFVQLRQGVGGARDGVGLGLSICRDLAQAMEGRLSVESRLGAGSTFELTLPRASA